MRNGASSSRNSSGKTTCSPFPVATPPESPEPEPELELKLELKLELELELETRNQQI